MSQFWIALVIFVCLGLTPLVLASVLNRRSTRDGESGGSQQ